MGLNIDFEDFANWGYSETERERAHAAVSQFVSEADGWELWQNLASIVDWYVKSPYEEDVAHLLDVFHERLSKEYELLPSMEAESLEGDDEDFVDDAEEKHSDYTAVERILRCVAFDIPISAIASNADTIREIADLASQYLYVAVSENMLRSDQLDEFVSRLARVAGFADYFGLGNTAMRSDAVETLIEWFPDKESVHRVFADSFVRGLAHDRRARTLNRRLPWLRWFFDEIPKDEFWRAVFASNPYPLSQGFLFMVWETDAPFADWERAMWYHRLGQFSESGLKWDADAVLHMGRESELVGRLLCR